MFFWANIATSRLHISSRVKLRDPAATLGISRKYFSSTRRGSLTKSKHLLLFVNANIRCINFSIRPTVKTSQNQIIGVAACLNKLYTSSQHRKEPHAGHNGSFYEVKTRLAYRIFRFHLDPFRIFTMCSYEDVGQQKPSEMILEMRSLYE